MSNTDPCALPDGPVAIQFSGGRTSGYMLRHILDRHGGVLPPHCHVLFQNTGREMPQTLDFASRYWRFVEECGARWNVEIVWLEYDPDSKTQWRRVGPGTNTPASQDGEPFEALIDKRKYLPNQRHRLCTEMLKVRPAIGYLRDWLGYEHWHAVIGIRADEMHRAKRREGRRHTVVWPLIQAGVTRRAVQAWWQAQTQTSIAAPISGGVMSERIQRKRNRVGEKFVRISRNGDRMAVHVVNRAHADVLLEIASQ